MSSKLSELKGKRFGKLSVINFSEISRNGHSRWFVKCDCGTIKTVLGTHLIQNKTISCGCEWGGRKNWKGSDNVSLTYFSSLRRGADGGKGRKPINFDITIEFISDLLEKQQNKCALSGLPISIRSKTASLDRIDSSLGYTENNVQWLHKDVNMMKRHYTTEYFTELCKLVSQNA